MGVFTAGDFAKLNLTDEKDKICVRISTGAPVPDGFDSVVQVEDTEVTKTTEAR